MDGRKRHDDVTKYYVYVLWLRGYSLNYVRRFTSMAVEKSLTRDQIWGILQNTPYQKRAEMTTMERQGHLDILREHRLDDNRMADFVFVADKIWGKKS